MTRIPKRVKRWAYKDTGKWDPERNTREFLAAMPEWRKHGLTRFTINLQGGSPGRVFQRTAVEQYRDRADGSCGPNTWRA